MDLMSAITERSNMLQAYHRVCRNKGAPGVDGVSTDELKGYLQTQWARSMVELGCFAHESGGTEKVV
jgi:hypothetical protein